MLRKTSLLALLCFAPNAQAASDFLIKVEGFVNSSSGPLGGALAGVQVGDQVTLHMQFDEDSAGPFGVGTVLIGFEEVHLQIGSAEVRADPAPFTSAAVGNDEPFPGFPQVDYIAAGRALEPGQTIFLIVQDPAGQIFSTNQLSQEAGVYSLGSDSSCELTDANTNGGVLFALSSMEIVPNASVGTVICASAVPNSTGLPGRLTANGYDLVEVNKLAVMAEDLPVGQTTLLLNSRVQAAPYSVLGSDGLLCIGQPIGRYYGQVATADALGRATFPLDLERTPTPTGLVGISVGETWTFQAWSRDTSPSGGTSNFTTGIAVTFR